MELPHRARRLELEPARAAGCGADLGRRPALEALMRWRHLRVLR